jgi:acyl-CoA thioesterase
MVYRLNHTPSNMTAHTPNAVAAAMFAKDLTAHDLNIELLAVGAGTAALCMRVRQAMTNGVGTAHGGYIFTLADTAFAYACNSGNQMAVAADCSIQFLRPAFAGNMLKAVARQTATAGRMGVYDVLVTDADSGAVIATFRGKSALIQGTHLPET